MANGRDCVELTEDGTWESFPALAQALVKQVGANVLERIDGPDIRLWIILVDGHKLSLVYNDYPNGITIEPRDDSSSTLIARMHASFVAESSADGV
jgi:hypothetical protein